MNHDKVPNSYNLVATTVPHFLCVSVSWHVPAILSISINQYAKNNPDAKGYTL